MKKLTVLQMLPALDSGGVERGTLEVGKYLVERGHRSLVMSAGGRLVTQLEAEGSEHLAWDVGRKSLLTPLRFVGRLRQLLRERQVDVLHVRSRMPAWVGYLAWKGMEPAHRPRFVSTVHGMYSVNAYSGVMTRGEVVIVVSETTRRYVLDNYPAVPVQRIRLIYRGVDRTHYPYGLVPDPAWLAAWQAQYPQALGRRLITLPGRITRLKGHEDFLQLLARLKAEGQPVHGLIVGGAETAKRPYLEELQAQARDLGLADDVTFTGQRADLREIMAISDLVLSLSTQPESFGRTALEALSLGVPVCGYNHGGVGEQLQALLPQGAVPLGDRDALARTVAAFLAEPPAVPQDHPFTLDNMLESTLKVYSTLCTSAPGEESTLAA